MKKSLFTFLFIISVNSYSEVNNAIIYNKSLTSKIKSSLQNFSFNYYVKYLGPSLGDGYKSGETFDRFNSGQNYTGGENEARGSYEVYQSFRLGYHFKNNSVLSYGVTFQEDLHEANAKQYDKSGKRMSDYKYQKGYSDNNHRISYWSPIFANNKFFISAATYYEMPTSRSSQLSGMKYGVGIQPTIGFFTSNPKVMTGFNFSFERDFYKENESPVYFSDGSKSKYPNKYQVARVAASPYFNYAVTDLLTLKSSLVFDWDQQGNQADTMKFNNNMVDILSLGAGYRFTKNIAGDFFVEAGIETPGINKTSTGFALTINI